MSRHSLIFDDSFTTGTNRTLYARDTLLDDVDPPVRIMREVLFHADAAGDVFTLDIFPGGTGTTIKIKPDNLEREEIVAGGKTGYRVKFKEETNFRVETTTPAARNSMGLVDVKATIKTRVMIKFPPGVGSDALAEEHEEALGLTAGQFQVDYTDGTQETYTASSLKTHATGEKHETSSSPSRTIKQIEYYAQSTSDSFTLTVMPAGNDTTLDLDGITSTPVESGTKTGCKAKFAKSQTDFFVVTPDTNISKDRRIPTTVKIKFPSGGDPPQ